MDTATREAWYVGSYFPEEIFNGSFDLKTTIRHGSENSRKSWDNVQRVARSRQAVSELL